MPASGRGDAKEVCQEPWTLQGQEALGVELDAFHGGIAAGPSRGRHPTQTHHHLPGRPILERFCRPGRDLPPGGRHGFLQDDQAVVPGGREGIGYPCENTPSIMGNLAGLSMHDPGGSGHGHAVGEPDALVPQADSQEGDLPGKAGDHVVGHPRLLGRAGARGDDDVARGHGRGLIGGDLVVAHDLDLDRRATLGRAPGGDVQLPDPLDEVPGEAVIVVDQQHAHGGEHRRGWVRGWGAGVGVMGVSG